MFIRSFIARTNPVSQSASLPEEVQIEITAADEKVASKQSENRSRRMYSRSGRQEEDSRQDLMEEGTVRRGLPKKQVSRLVRRPSIHYVRSRDELLEEETQHFENLRKKIVKTRRTKVVGTISAKYSSYEDLKSMVQAGLNSFMVNMAYCTPDLLSTVRSHRDELEKEFGMQLPITCVLKGTLARICTLIQPEVFLRKGQEYRIVLNSKVLGNNLFCAVDDKDMIKRVKIGS